MMGIDLVSGFKTDVAPLVEHIENFVLLIDIIRIDQKPDLPGGEKLFHVLSAILFPVIFDELVCLDVMLLNLGLRVAK
ncbi:hypothetical protein D3C87_1987470 [compost metagenome]